MVTADDIEARLPRPLDTHERTRTEVLIDDAVKRIAAEFGRAGMDLQDRLEVQWFSDEYERVIREMVSAVVLVGINVGMTSASSSTMQESDSATFKDSDAVSWGGVTLTDQQRRDLGLPVAGKTLGRFPASPRWPERMLR
ncbi:MAG TPA: hypothetical protein DCL06_11260 [Corynebacterium variabile]|uniref:Phage protein Gp19/Gp15/Gp42 n=1 Tax=Corynebacterium variabile TaxID=1727 RepID=A0A3B9QWI2_9CORY|nr:hypothetical protein [Corynebacterium variabile]